MSRTDTRATRSERFGPRPLVALTSFAALAKKAARLDALDRALRQTLPTPLREQTRFADLRHGRLVFVVSTPAWASRLRSLHNQLLATAKALGAEADSIRIKVAPVPAPAPGPPPPKTLSSSAADHLRAAARAAGDPEIGELFERLAALAPHEEGALKKQRPQRTPRP